MDGLPMQDSVSKVFIHLFLQHQYLLEFFLGNLQQHSINFKIFYFKFLWKSWEKLELEVLK
jgi:hypothetical protein